MIQLRKTQAGDIFLAGFKNLAREGDALFVQRQQLRARVAGGGHQLGDGMMRLANLSGDLAGGLGKPLARGDGFGLGLGSAGLAIVKNRQRQGCGRPE